MYGGYIRTLRGFRARASVSGSYEAILSRVHAHLLWNARQLRQSEGNYRGRAEQYRVAAQHVRRAIDVLVGAYLR